MGDGMTRADSVALMRAAHWDEWIYAVARHRMKQALVRPKVEVESILEGKTWPAAWETLEAYQEYLEKVQQ
jgi:hypothetical protein